MVHSTAMVQDMWLSFTKAASALLDPLYATVSTNHLFQQPDSRQISTSCFYLSLTTWILIQKQSRVSSKCWSLLDHLLVTLTCIKVQFYSKGMGDEALYKTCVKRLKALVRGEDIVGLPKDLMLNEWSTLGDIRVCSGSFLSPIADLLPSQAAIQHAHMEIICPKDSSFGSVLSEGKPIIIHLPGTGDEHFSVRRILLAKPLATKHGITSIILQVPFYGSRRAEGQQSYGLDTVEHTASQILGIVTEANAIVRWLYDEMDFKGSIGFTGISFGGAMTALSSLICPYPHVAVGHVPSCSREDVFVYGELSRTIRWSTVKGGKSKIQDTLGLIDTANFITKDLLVENDNRKFPIPPRVYHQLTALDDQYVPYKSGIRLYDTMKKVPHMMHHELEIIYGGHISAIVLQREQYLQSIVRALVVLGLEHKAQPTS